MKESKRFNELKSLQSYEEHLEQLKRDDPNYEYDEDFMKNLVSTKQSINRLKNTNIDEITQKCKYSYDGSVYYRGKVIGNIKESSIVSGTESNNFNATKAINNIIYKIRSLTNHKNDSACTITTSKITRKFI